MVYPAGTERRGGEGMRVSFKCSNCSRNCSLDVDEVPRRDLQEDIQRYHQCPVRNSGYNASWRQVNGNNVEQVLDKLNKSAQEYAPKAAESISHNRHMNELPKGAKVVQFAIDAVLVDYINYVAGTYGVDYAMNTSDLPTRGLKCKGAFDLDCRECRACDDYGEEYVDEELTLLHYFCKRGISKKAEGDDVLERLNNTDMVGAVLFVKDDELFARMPDGRIVKIDADIDYGVSYLTFEVWEDAPKEKPATGDRFANLDY
jgi:hypothetical protein